MSANSKTLNARIDAFANTIDKAKAEAHVLACESIELAVQGRCDYMNRLYAVLPSLLQDAFKAFVATEMTHKVKDAEGKEILNKWCNFETRAPEKSGRPARGFYIIPDTSNFRPSVEHIDKIKADLSKSFFNKRAAVVKKQNDGFDLEGNIARLDNLAKTIEAALLNGQIEGDMQNVLRIKELATTMRKTLKPHLATVDGVNVEAVAQPAPVEAPSPIPADTTAKNGTKRPRKAA